jgi:predicted TIM-barrel fold metal-dependent hydrolase
MGAVFCSQRKITEDDAMLTRRAMLGRVGTAAGAAWAMRAGVAAGAASRTAVDFEVPRGACDCHVHVFGDPARFPFAEKRVYTPPQASVEQLLELQRDLHLDRVVVVQPSVYGADNACTIDAVRQMGARARGVAVIDKATSRKALEEMAAAGIRGVRLNLETNTVGRFDPADAKAVLDATAEQIRGLGWHVQIYTRTSVIAALKEHLAGMPFPVVADHFGRGNPTQGPSQPDFAALLDLVRSGAVYVKISGAYRISENAPDFADATPLAQALVAANPDRIVWGTDWPHPNSDYGRGKPLTEISPPFPIDDGLLLNQLPKWVPDAALRKKILVDNPARLYGFAAVAG